MAKSYGNTWWGKRWLDALTQIDWDNRIPRGRRYANNGSVKSIQIKGNAISAKVQGSRPQPYKVEIRVPQFATGEADRLRVAIQGNAGAYAAILNQELAPVINDIAEQAGLRIFPKSWTDLDMACSCPDWAVPCKHLAAVIYLVAEAIDRNPMHLFEMKGLDLKSVMSAHKSDEFRVAIPRIGDYFVPKAPKTYQETKPIEGLRNLDLSKLPPLHDKMYKLLAPKPLFFEGDFREEWARRIAKAGKNLGKWLEQWAGEEGLKRPELRKGYAVNLYVGADWEVVQVAINSPGDDAYQAMPFSELLESLFAMGLDDLPEMHSSVEALWHVAQVCRVLLAQGAIKAQLVQTRPDVYGIVWLPADNSPAVAAVMQAMEAALPPDLVGLRDPRSKKGSALPARAGKVAQVICSLFFKALIAEFSTDALQAKTHKRQPFLEVPRAQDPVTDMFWGGVAVQFTGFGGDSMAPAIQKWLSIFEAGSHDWRPILEVRADDAGNFALDLSLEPTSGALQVPVPLSTFLSDAHYTTDRTAVLQALYILAGVVPPVHQLLANGGGLPAPIDPEQILEVLLAQLPLVELLGIQVRLPRELKELVRPKLSVRIDTKGQEQAAFSLGDIFAFDWQVALGDVFLTPEEFLKLVRAQHGLVMLRGQYVLIQPDELERLRKRLERGPRPGPHQLFHAALTGEFEGAPAKLSGQVLQLIESITAIQNLPVPAGIQATLRPYQQGGFEWMYKNAQLGMGSVIADDMGLGKTLQVLCLLEQLRSEGKLQQAPALAVVPTSLLANWKKEAERFAPHLNVHLFHGADRKLPTEAVDLMVTTYGVVRSDLAKLKKRNWSLAVIDEAQNIKNPATAQSKAIRELPAPLRIAMSGTPVENRLSDYWSIMDFALPGYLGTQKEFRTDYGIPITNYRDTEALRRFHLVTAPFILRRLKTDPKVISDLPDKIIQNQWSVLTQAQAAIYEGVVQECMHAITAAETAIARQGLVLKMLTALKQVCNHPAQYLGKGAPDSAESGKAQVFLQLVESIVAQHEKCLVFTQYTEMANLLVQMLRQELGVEASLLHGGLSPKQREALVTEFQTASHRKVFILSLKAGGTGLNLTAANHVIHYDLWWNPAVENQATDRAFRIGQKKNVLVHRLICKGTMEERIDELINSKRDLAALAVAGGEKWIGELGNKDLRELVALTM